MRPSMRVPLREARFVCSSCRPVSAPRVSPLGQFRRYASDSPGFLERTRRKLWGTDSPPGQADPYTGSQILPETGLSAGEEKPADEDFNLTQRDDQLDVDNLNWNELPRIGYLPKNEWKIKGSKKGDRVTPWYHNKNPLIQSQAVHQAAVEIALAQIVGKRYSTEGLDLPRQHLQQCKFEGQAEEWGDRLRFPNAKVMFNLLSKASGSSGRSRSLKSLFSALEESGDNHPAVYKQTPDNEAQSTIDSLSLADGKTKFAFFSRVSKLMSQRLSDSILGHSTVGEVKSAHEELLKKTARSNPVILHEVMNNNGAADLPNVKITDVRRTRHDNDEDLGRKKAIVTALYTNGLIKKALVPQKPKPKWIRESAQAKKLKKSMV
ncbi:unnamed protein product [Penicillium salamii]|nr:unnamed protein product [Penicillium salamii]CAG8171493.1 unnamed protein product [Penicillium salamii]CAG8243862.1 unnamed protein product [Penicillium salamii]